MKRKTVITVSTIVVIVSGIVVWFAPQQHVNVGHPSRVVAAKETTNNVNNVPADQSEVRSGTLTGNEASKVTDTSVTNPVQQSKAHIGHVAHPHMYHITIIVNGKKEAYPYAFLHLNTTFIPLYYIHDILKSWGVKDTWQGARDPLTWTITTEDELVPNLRIVARGGDMDMVLDGTVVETNVPTAEAVDPASGVVTTFIPIWYAQKVLAAIGHDSNWNEDVVTGQTWVIS